MGTRKIIVYHAGYGCDTGCCGHVVKITTGDEVTTDRFYFDHPYKEDDREFVRRLVTEEFGEDHVADIDWDDVLVVDD